MDNNVRREAKLAILQAVNINKINVARRTKNMFPVALWGMRNIQRAVHVARKYKLVESNVILAAGYKENNTYD